MYIFDIIHISITRVPMAIQLGRMVTYLDGLLPPNSHDPLISYGLARLHDKLKPYLSYHNTYAHKTSQNGHLL